MIKYIFRAYIFAFLLFSNNAFANFYLGGVYTFTFVDLNLPSGEEFSPTALVFKGGYDLIDYVGLELRAGAGVTEGSRVSAGVERTLSIDALYGGYLKLQGGGREFNPYFMLGYTQGEFEAADGTTSTKVDDSSASFGIGVDGVLSETVFYTLEYMHYYDKDDVTVSGVGVGITARF